MLSVATAPRARKTESLEEARESAVCVFEKGEFVLVIGHTEISLWAGKTRRWLTSHCLRVEDVHDVIFTERYVDLLNRASVRMLRLAIHDGTRPVVR